MFKSNVGNNYLLHVFFFKFQMQLAVILEVFSHLATLRNLPVPFLPHDSIQATILTKSFITDQFQGTLWQVRYVSALTLNLSCHSITGNIQRALCRSHLKLLKLHHIHTRTMITASLMLQYNDDINFSPQSGTKFQAFSWFTESYKKTYLQLNLKVNILYQLHYTTLYNKDPGNVPGKHGSFSRLIATEFTTTSSALAHSLVT